MNADSIRGSGRYTEAVTRTTRAVLDGPGVTPSRQRWAAFHRRFDELPPELRGYVEKVAMHAYRITDDDVAALQRAGHGEDVIFELTAAAALGAAITRLERGLIVLRESGA
jgi:hypothetical protein